MERLTKERRREIVDAFVAKHGDDPNFNEAVMRYSLWDGDYLEIKVKDIWAPMVAELPQIFNGRNVFVAEAPPVRIPLPQD